MRDEREEWMVKTEMVGLQGLLHGLAHSVTIILCWKLLTVGAWH